MLKIQNLSVSYGPRQILHDVSFEVKSGEVLALIVNGQSVESASFGDPVEVILPKTGFYIESGGQVSDEGVIRSFSGDKGEEIGEWEIEVTDVRRASAGVRPYQRLKAR